MNVWEGPGEPTREPPKITDRRSGSRAGERRPYEHPGPVGGSSAVAAQAEARERLAREQAAAQAARRAEEAARAERQRDAERQHHAGREQLARSRAEQHEHEVERYRAVLATIAERFRAARADLDRDLDDLDARGVADGLAGLFGIHRDAWRAAQTVQDAAHEGYLARAIEAVAAYQADRLPGPHDPLLGRLEVAARNPRPRDGGIAVRADAELRAAGLPEAMHPTVADLAGERVAERASRAREALGLG